MILKIKKGDSVSMNKVKKGDSVSMNKVKKGDSVSLSKADPSLERAVVGAGWDPAESGEPFDLDLSAFLLNSQGRVRSSKDLVFHNRLRSADGSVKHTGDNRDGEGSGDNEQIKVNLAKVSSDIDRIVFVVSIDEYEQRRQNFGRVGHSFIRIVNADNKREVLRYDLDEDYSSETAVIFGELYRQDGGWRFKAARGQGFAGGLGGACRRYGVNVN